MSAVEEIYQYTMNSSARLKREDVELSLEEKAEICSELELQQKSTDIAANIIGDISSLPIVGKIVGTMAAAMMAIAHVGSGALDIQQTLLGCSDLPFDEIKEIMEQKFNEIDRKLDSHSKALEEITKLAEKTLSSVEKTRKQMNKRFDEVLESIKNTNIAPIVSKISNFGRYFDAEAERIRGLNLNDYVAKLEEEKGILYYLRESRTPKGDGLHAPLLIIINEGYAIPASINDELAFKALDALLYGTQTYVSVMFFLLEQYSFLANYYYGKGELDIYNKYFDSITNIFLDFKSSLVGSGGSDSAALLESVLQVLVAVKSKEFLKFLEMDVVVMLNEKISLFSKIKEDVDGKERITSSLTPENYVHISFEKDIPTPFGDWKEDKEVRYAVQYESETLFSKVSHWSNPITVRGKACPTLRMPVDQNRKSILVFRKFENRKPQLVGSVSPYQSNFIDIDRDLYNAAGNPDLDVGHREVVKLVANGANIKAPFEQGRTALHAAAESGNAKVMFGLVLMSLGDLNKPDKNGFTAIHAAADKGNAGIVNLLIDYSASVNVKTYRTLQTPLHLAARRGFKRTFDRLLESPDININEKDKDGFTPLHSAVLGGKEIVKAFINQPGTDINAKSEKGLTPFHLAIINDDWPVAETLLTSESLQVNANDENNNTPLHYAVMLGHLEIMKKLINLSQVNVNAVSIPNLWSALHYAIFFKRDDVTLELLKILKVDKDLQSLGGITPLHLAVSLGRKTVVSEMVRIGINLEQKTTEDFTPLHLAAMSKYPEIVTFLIDQGSNMEAKTANGATPLLLATLKGREQASMILLGNEVNFRAVDKDGQMPIHGAAMNGMLEIAREIINLEPSIVAAQNNNLDTPLNLAAQHLHPEMVKFLVGRKADINTKNKDGNAPLLAFSKMGNLDMIKFLISNGADVYIADNDGLNFFYYAVRHGHLNIIKYAMSERKFTWSTPDNNRRRECPNEECAISHFAVCDAIQYGKINVVKYFVGTLQHFSICRPLITAAMYGQLDIVKYLVEEEELNVNVAKPGTPLCHAAENGYLDVVKYLVENGSEINRDCVRGETAIDMAISKNHINVVRYLVKKGADLRRRNALGSTPFFTAVSSNSLDIARYFINEKIGDIDINEQNEKGESALHLAVYYRNLQMVKLLVQNGINVGIRNAIGKTALEIARDARFSRIVEYLNTKSRRFRKGFQILRNAQGYPHMNMISNFIGSKNIEHDHQRFLNSDVEESKTFLNSPSFQNIDVIGTLLLVDVLIRYFTKQGYINEENDSASDEGVQAAALEITENFENFLNVFDDTPKEQVDLTEVHRKVYAALKSGRKSQIHQVLCSSLKSVSKLEPAEIETLVSELLNLQSSFPLTKFPPSTAEAFENSLHILGESCLNSEWSPSLMLM